LIRRSAPPKRFFDAARNGSPQQGRCKNRPIRAQKAQLDRSNTWNEPSISLYYCESTFKNGNIRQLIEMISSIFQQNLGIDALVVTNGTK